MAPSTSLWHLVSLSSIPHGASLEYLQNIQLLCWHAAPMHMSMWGHGRVDADEGSIIDAILGIPAYTIKMAGIHGLPHDYMMQISARGSAYKPDIDWLR